MSQNQHHIKLGNITIGNDLPFVLLAGPCQMESRDHAFEMASALKEMTDRLGIGLIYKSSFDKANRTSVSSYRGLGFEEGLSILKKVKEITGLKVITDVHESWQCEKVAKVVDIIQIPAFLCRQTDLIEAASKTN